jgi:hypothetical protein
MSNLYRILASTSTLVAALAPSPGLIMARDKPSLPPQDDIIRKMVERARAEARSQKEVETR